MSRWLKCTSTYFNTDWNKYDDRLMKAVERGEVDKVAGVLSKKGIIPTKLDVEGRSAFHLAATRGHLDCLSLILGHNVDVTATDATGKNALHLAARNGQSLCVQKLLQHNCPVGNVDLQGRTALHDAVMAGCASSVKLLCDSGASVNASDFDGRTPLVLATQMCHPRICQLLLERGADITVRDKQNKTALILGCEYACKDAVEVLLRGGADVTAMDGFGHDSYHYARLSKNTELVTLVKGYLDSANKAKETARMELKKRQQSAEKSVEAATNANKDQMIHDLERQNETQQESLRKFHQEQRALMDKVNILQQQLNQEKSAVEDIHMEREQLKRLLSAKEREDGARPAETVKVQMKSHVGDYSGQSVIKGRENVLVRQSHSLDSDQVLQSAAPTRSVSRPLELTRTPSVASSGESESLRRELEALRRRQEASEEEMSQLQEALSHKTKECEDLAQSRDATKRDADQQVRQLEEALGDVQKRMLDSEAKVKQLQAHVVAVKEHLSNQLVEDLKAQLGDLKAKYEGASAEVGRVRNHLKQSEKALEEYKKSEGQLAVEAERLTQELNVLKEEREDMADTLLDMEAHVKEVEVRLGAMVPAEKFDNMKNLLSNAVDEKEKQLAELRDDYDRVLEEVAELHREMDSRSGPGAVNVPLQEHERVRAALEEQSASLKRKLADVTAKSQALIQEVEESEEEREVLREQLEDLKDQIQSEYVPLESHEDVQRSLGRAVEDLKEKLLEAVENKKLVEEELQRLQEEKTSLCENLTHLTSTHVSSETFESEVGTLTTHKAELEKELENIRQRYEDREKELREVLAEKKVLEKSLTAKEDYERLKAELNAVLEQSRNQISTLEKDGKAKEEELQKVKEGSAKLKEELEKVQTALSTDYTRLSDHETVIGRLNSALAEAGEKAKDALSKYQSAQEDNAKLHKEIEEQKKELDTIQEAIQVKFVPLSVMQDKESSFEAALKDLNEQLTEMQEKYDQEKTESERRKREAERLEGELQEALRRLEADLESGDGPGEAEEQQKGRSEELSLKLVDLEQQYKEVTVQRAELEEQNALCATEITALQRRLEVEYVRLERFEAMQQALTESLQQAQEQCQQAQAAQRQEAERVRELEKQLQSRDASQDVAATAASAALLAEQEEARGALEREVSQLRLALREEEESSAQRAEDVAALQSELLRATQALEELRGREEEEVGELRLDKQRLEEEVLDLGERLSGLAEQYDDLYHETVLRRDGEAQARAEADTLQAKSTAIEGEIRELKERYDDSLHTIGELQKRIQMSSDQTEAKDKRITELLADVERLKQALNGLSQLAYAGSAPNKRQTQHIDALQAQVKSLQQQLADAERQHREVVSIYRTHLLSAAQGHMDEDVQAALLQIIRMRQEFVC